MSHNTLSNYYLLNFTLTHKFNYSIREIEQLIPFERDLYIDLIQKELSEKQQ